MTSNEFENPYAEAEFGNTRADEETSNGRLKFASGDKKVIRFVSSKVEHKIHWKVIPKHKRIVCRKTIGKDEECPICTYVAQINDPAGRAKWACSVNVIDYTDGQLKQWDFSITTKKAIFDAIRNSGSISKENPINNFKIMVERIGIEMKTIYKITIARKATKLTDDERGLLADMKPITDNFKVLSVSELRGFITGESEVDNREVNVNAGDTFDTKEAPKVEKKVETVVEEPKIEKKKESKKTEPLADEEDLF